MLLPSTTAHLTLTILFHARASFRVAPFPRASVLRSSSTRDEAATSRRGVNCPPRPTAFPNNSTRDVAIGDARDAARGDEVVCAGMYLASGRAGASARTEARGRASEIGRDRGEQWTRERCERGRRRRRGGGGGGLHLGSWWCERSSHHAPAGCVSGRRTVDAAAEPVLHAELGSAERTENVSEVQ